MHRLLAAIWLVAAAAYAQPLEIVNRHGAVTVEVVAAPHLRAWRVGGDPDAHEGVVTSRSPGRVLIEALPPEGGGADIGLQIPLGVPFSIRTVDGDISLTGMVRRVRVQSTRGSLALAVPMETTQLSIEATERPAHYSVPDGHRLQMVPIGIRPRLRIWKVSHNLRSRDLGYGMVEAQLHLPPSLTVRDWKIPDDWPLKPHSHSKGAVERLLASAERRSAGESGRPAHSPRNSVAQEFPDPSEDAAIFKAEVRMVSLSVAVSDSAGRPLGGLVREDFAVEEDGERQDIQVATAEESPFNMAILLDLSGSTAVDLEHMRQAALRLIELAGVRDRVGLYAMAGSLFHRLAPLTADHDEVAARVRALPYPSGGSPLWDTIALAYDDVFPDRVGERNALIVISDGIDNRISGQSVPSMLRASRLIQVAGEMEARIYPIFLLSGERFGRSWSAKARSRMTSLARKTGGRLFTARSIQDIDPVLPELAREMRSVYAVAYYPANQVFEGNWRRVRIKVDVPGARVRARPGYFAD